MSHPQMMTIDAFPNAVYIPVASPTMSFNSIAGFEMPILIDPGYVFQFTPMMTDALGHGVSAFEIEPALVLLGFTYVAQTVVLDPATHAATLVSAGHSSPLLYRASTGEFKEAMPRDVAGVPLGIMDGFPYESYQINLAAGDNVVLFTDGVNESMSASNVEFGMEGVHRVLREAGNAGPRQLVERLVSAVKQHATGRDPHDDLTVVALGRCR